MSYLPHTAHEREEMLARVGVTSVDELFEVVPEDVRYPRVDLPDPLTEAELMTELRAMAERNADLNHAPCFVGAGAYHRFVPAVVGQIVGRSEFLTAYTPYQPEISQGTLQATFEYQSMICELTGMEVSNASHYDGATATAEAVIMAHSASHGRRTRAVLSPTVHPEYRQVVRTYLQGAQFDIVGDESISDDAPEHQLADLLDLVDDNTACVVVQSPAFTGEILDLTGLAERVHAHGAMLVMVSDPIALGMLRSPGAWGADIAVGDGGSLGSPLSFGGPSLGFFACRKADVRRMAGRLVGQTEDADGQRGYVLTLATREQHIRREKASSNICTNQGLNALAAAVYLAALGKHGLGALARVVYHRAHHAAARISELDGYELVSKGPFFQEFVVECPEPARSVNQRLWERHGIIGGYDLGQVTPAWERRMLVCVTEMNPVAQIDALVAALEEVAS
ncbi:MAG: aminomethyl-transferring glycine dehydrogenase subunit GcvPA [Anaerolineae bacterium]|nr:aminomethyl-transferring glycine dehydrogenase subunit GcvPA [Anaerolineae bacterium]